METRPQAEAGPAAPGPGHTSPLPLKALMAGMRSTYPPPRRSPAILAVGTPVANQALIQVPSAVGAELAEEALVGQSAVRLDVVGIGASGNLTI